MGASRRLGSPTTSPSAAAPPSISPRPSLSCRASFARHGSSSSVTTPMPLLPATSWTWWTSARHAGASLPPRASFPPISSPGSSRPWMVTWPLLPSPCSTLSGESSRSSRAPSAPTPFSMPSHERCRHWAGCIGRAKSAASASRPEGLVALGMVGTYGHALAYLPMLEQVPAALFSEVPWPAAAPGQAERHVDRARDVAVSGEVFSKFVAVPFLEIFLPAFDVEALADQPRAIVDVGCGDASMLVALGEAVRSRTLRGRHPGRVPPGNHRDRLPRGGPRRGHANPAQGRPPLPGPPGRHRRPGGPGP